jgi:citrate synthase
MPDGSIHKIPVLTGSVGPPVIDIRNLYTQTGHFTFDPGFTCTSSCLSAITYIDGEEGELWYRGYRVQELAENCGFLEVCYLLLYNELPTQPELNRFERAIKDEMCINSKLIDFYQAFQQGAHPMAIMVGVVGALSAFFHEDMDVHDPAQREAAAVKIVAKIPMIAAVAYRTAYGLPIVYPKKQYSYVENFLYMMFADPMSDEFEVNHLVVEALEKILILHADHEQNASTSTVRIAGSSFANPFACIAAGIACLWGPMHGGANEAVLGMLDEIGGVENIPRFIERAKSRDDSFRLMGFGHRVYKTMDPRNSVMSDIAHRIVDSKVGADQVRFLELATALEKAALEDEYFVSRRLYPNVDFYSGIVLEAMGIPRTMFTVIFALSRCIGWISQWREMMSEKIKKIGRPRQLYVGHTQRSIVPINERNESNLISQSVLNQPRIVWSARKRSTL